MLQRYIPKYFIYFSLLLQQMFSCEKLQVFYLDVTYDFTHILQVYVLDVSSVSYVCCIQVFHVTRVSCCSDSQVRRRMGRGEPVVGVRLRGQANGWG
jgi:hypothetical protein